MLPASAQKKFSIVKMQVERLSDLNVPRIGHKVFCVGGEVVAAGGHTSGFVPTATAEYYRDGAWHLMTTTYTHDQGGLMTTPEGGVLLFGGHEKELGIGQTFTLERYDPAAHRFTGYGCLELKRCMANALPLDSGRVVVSGNWYHDDAIEIYDGSRQNKFLKPVAQHRSLPHILRTARDNAIIFSAFDIHANPFDTIIIDRLKGESFTAPLFDTWRPYHYPVGYSGACSIGNEAGGEYVNLIQVMRPSPSGGAGGGWQMAIAQVKGEDFSLLPTTVPIPMRSQWGRIEWFCHILADKTIARAYIQGYGEDRGDHRIYVVAIDYKKSPAPITLYYSEPQHSVGRCQPVLTPDGNLMLVGGVLEHNNNYDAASTVFLLHLSPNGQAHPAASISLWVWIPLASLTVVALLAVVMAMRRHCRKSKAADEETSTTCVYEELMVHLCEYMEKEKPFLNSHLKIDDVAKAMNSNRTYISNTIKATRGITFSQFVNLYRVEYSKELLRLNKDIRISEVWPSAGFSNETSFFRTFKSVTGVSPKEWKSQ